MIETSIKLVFDCVNILHDTTGKAESGAWAGLAPPTFLEEKCFCLSIRYTLKALEVPVILHLIQVELF